MQGSGIAHLPTGDLYYEVQGTGHPLVLVHSLLTHSGLWDDQIKAFAPLFTVIRYDLGGFGKSPMSAAPDSLMLKQLLDFLGITKTHILGLSMGAEVALQFTLDYPDAVTSLSLISSGLDGFDYPEDASQRWQNFITPVQERDFSKAREVFMRQVGDGPISPAAPQVRERMRQLMDGYTFVNFFPPENPSESEATAVEETPHIPALERLGEIRVPTLIMAGKRDQPDAIAVAEVLAEKIPNSQKVVVPNAAHIINLEEPDLFNQTVLDFLAHTGNA